MPEKKIHARISALGRRVSLYDVSKELKEGTGVMLTEDAAREYYRALLAKESSYEGTFFVGVTTTGVFCRPTCSARKPKFEHCEFYPTAEAALLASYRPCKRCRPLSHPHDMSPVVQMLVDAVESNPEKRWTDRDFEKISVHASTARRHFQKRFGMTFVAYARARRMGMAMEQIRSGSTVIEAQLAAGYESGSGFRDAFSRIMGAAPSFSDKAHALFASWIDTGLGPMVAIANTDALYLVEFVDRRGLEREVERLRQKTKAPILPGRNAVIELLERELAEYFGGQRTTFETPLHSLGTPFERRVWEALRHIPFGETRSYGDIARTIGEPLAFRAVARANGANTCAIVIPCHRVVQTDGGLGGYGGGVARKEWLLNHERGMTVPGGMTSWLTHS